MLANLLDYDLEGLAAFCERLGEKRFRATQLFRWIHQKGAADFDAMTDLARSLREKLRDVAEIRMPVVNSEQRSADGTIKVTPSKPFSFPNRIAAPCASRHRQDAP